MLPGVLSGPGVKSAAYGLKLSSTHRSRNRSIMETVTCSPASMNSRGSKTAKWSLASSLSRP